MKLETVDFIYYDYISKMEELLKIYVNEMKKLNGSFSQVNILFTKLEYQMAYFLTIITILYKEQQINNYIEEKTIDTDYFIDYSDINEELEFIISKLTYAMNEKDIQLSNSIISEHGKLIDEIVRNFYKRKEKNYIQEKLDLQLIVDQDKAKELLKINPFAINQIILYNYIRMTKEEKIISDTHEFHRVATLNEIKNQKEAMKCIKELLLTNYNNKEELIIFILGNVYQEAQENKIVEIYNELKYIIENPKITNEQIKDYFIKTDTFSTKIISSFLTFTSKISFTRLKELEELPSYSYIKKRYEQ